MNSLESLQARIRELEALQQAAWAVLDHCGFGVVIVQPQRKILHQNRLAVALIAESNVLRINFGQLVCNLPHIEKWLAHKIQTICCTSGQCTGCIEPNGVRVRQGTRSLHMIAVPLTLEKPGLGNGFCALFISDNQIEIEPIRANLLAVYRLTRREAEIVSHVILGRSALDISKELLIGESTVRTHIKRAYQKMDVSCQADLVRTGLSLNVGFG